MPFVYINNDRILKVFAIDQKWPTHYYKTIYINSYTNRYTPIGKNE